MIVTDVPPLKPGVQQDAVISELSRRRKSRAIALPGYVALAALAIDAFPQRRTAPETQSGF